MASGTLPERACGPMVFILTGLGDGSVESGWILRGWRSANGGRDRIAG